MEEIILVSNESGIRIDACFAERSKIIQGRIYKSL